MAFHHSDVPDIASDTCDRVCYIDMSREHCHYISHAAIDHAAVGMHIA